MFTFVINEISPASDPEWVELYTSETANLQNCTLYLHGSEDTNQKITFDESIEIQNYFVIKKGQFEWNSNWLNNSGDTVSIKCGEQIDSYTYSNEGGKTVGRSPDGTGNFFVLSQSSEGQANSPPTSPPTPISTPSPAPTNTPTPTVIPTKSPTSIPTPSSTSKPEVKALVTSSMPTPSSTAITETEIKPKEQEPNPPVSIVLIVTGAVLVGAGAFPFVKKLYNEKYAPASKVP